MAKIRVPQLDELIPDQPQRTRKNRPAGRSRVAPLVREDTSEGNVPPCGSEEFETVVVGGDLFCVTKKSAYKYNAETNEFHRVKFAKR